jgi:molybdenum cofactor synthesis domain-containing protein
MFFFFSRQRDPSYTPFDEHPTYVSVLIIGNEILSGEVRDQAAPYFLSKINALGFTLSRICFLPDNQREITIAIRELLPENRYIFTIGGLGAGHNDVTRAAIAEAFGVSLTLSREARCYLERFHRRSLESTQDAMILLPEGARLLGKPTTPSLGFWMKKLCALPGTPEWMEALFEESVQDMLLGGEKIYSTYLKIRQSEHKLQKIINTLQNQHPNIHMATFPCRDLEQEKGNNKEKEQTLLTLRCVREDILDIVKIIIKRQLKCHFIRYEETDNNMEDNNT